jgi:CheY-like chemotaxis protein
MGKRPLNKLEFGGVVSTKIELRFDPARTIFVTCRDFPLLHRPPPVPDKPDSARRAVKSKEAPRVLIVEDDAMIAWDMSLSLEAAGFQVCGIVSTGAAALEQAMAGGLDVVLMDVNLKEGMDGIETARALRERGRQTPVIFVTGFGDPETSERIRAINPNGYLLKPVMPEELEAAIIRALETGPDTDD